MKRQRILTGALALLVALASLYVGPTPVAHAATIIVNTTDDELNGDGDCSLREAIHSANTDGAYDQCGPGSGADTITLPAGFYTLTIPGAGENANVTGDLDITDDLTINGDVGSTIIQAGTNSTNGIDRVLDVHSGVTVEMNGLWIEYGRTPGTAGEIDGGGIRNWYGTLTLNNCYVASNTADWHGGGIYSEGGTLTLDNSTVGYNSTGYAGGIYNSGTLTVDNSAVSFNTAHFYAGGIYNHGTLTLSNSTVAGNTADWHGGGIYNSGTLTLNNSTIADNDADSDHDLLGNGGGICNAAWLILNNSTVADNTATYGGGIYNDGDNTVLLSRSTVADNGCVYSGGGIYNDNPSATVRLLRSTVNGNDAAMGHGGGIYNSGGDLSLDKCTVSGNTSDQSGGGIYSAGPLWLEFTTVADNAADLGGSGFGGGGGIYVSSGTAQARNTIIGDNQTWTSLAADCWGTLTSEGYNLVEDTTGCTFTPTTGDITGSDPNLGALGDNGGPTWTHALVGGSPAIEKIPDGTSGCQACVSVDQRGYLRACGAGYGGFSCDIGAYEYESGPPKVQFWLSIYNENESGGTATITVVLNVAPSDTVTVDYATSDGTATAGSDYTATSGVLTFDPGVTSQTFTVAILDDTLDEADETVTLTLSNPSNATIGTRNPATLTIVDDDGAGFFIYLPLVMRNFP